MNNWHIGTYLSPEKKLEKLFWDDIPESKRGIIVDSARLIERLLESLIIRILNHDIKARIPFTTVFGHGCIGVVISRETILGEYCHIGQNVTIGARKHISPIIEDGVVMLSNSIIIGDVRVGHHSIIGASALVIRDVPPYSVVVGVPARVIHTMKDDREYWYYREKRT